MSSGSLSLYQRLNHAGVVVSLSAKSDSDGTTTIGVKLIDKSRRWPDLGDFESADEYFAACEAIDREVCAEFGVAEKYIHINGRGDMMIRVFPNHRRDTAAWRWGFGMDSPNSKPGCDGDWTT